MFGRSGILEIRAVMPEDAEAIAAIRRQNGVREGVLALSSERINATAEFLNSLAERDRGFVAVENGEVVGFSVMIAGALPRAQRLYRGDGKRRLSADGDRAQTFETSGGPSRQ